MTDTPSTEAAPSAAVEEFDLIIVGSGSGNSIPESLAGWKIALVEKGIFGGTCLNVGCIPSKMFVLPADSIRIAEDGHRLGVATTPGPADWAAIRDRVFGRIDPISAGGEEYRASGTEGLTLVRGHGRFVAEKTIEVDGRRLHAPRILLATGSRPWAPPIPGLDEVRTHTSDTVMRLEEFPKRLGVLGGGFIAVEMGHVFSAYGAELHMFNRGEVLLRAEDAEIAERFTEVFGSHSRVNLHLGTVPERVEELDDGTIAIHHAGTDGEPVVTVVDELLLALGRRPNSDLLGLERTSVDVHDDGRVVVDEYFATTEPGIWAVGDVSNSFQLKHLANAEAKAAFANIAADAAGAAPTQVVDTRAVPHAVFSDPQVATVGMTEAQAAAAGLDVVVGKRDYAGTAYGWAMEDSSSFAKVIVERGTRRIVGAHIIGTQAASLIQPLIQAMQFDQPADVVADDVFYIHPALTEVVENALLDAVGQDS